MGAMISLHSYSTYIVHVHLTSTPYISNVWLMKYLQATRRDFSAFCLVTPKNREPRSQASIVMCLEWQKEAYQEKKDALTPCTREHTRMLHGRSHIHVHVYQYAHTWCRLAVNHKDRSNTVQMGPCMGARRTSAVIIKSSMLLLLTHSNVRCIVVHLVQAKPRTISIT